ncbi:TIGR03936 family radical SAM-associated protein [Planctomycetes bacterium CA13]
MSQEPTEPQSPQPPVLVPLRIRYRIRFEKKDLLRWISHRDLARLWERIIRRVALKPSMTEGFHPKPRIGFPSALALGVESFDEVVELDLAEDLAPLELLTRLENDNQPGLTIRSVGKLPEGFKKAQLLRSDYTLSIPDGTDVLKVQDAIENLKQQETVSIQRKKKQVVAKVATQIPTIEIDDQQIRISLAATDAASLKPNDVLDLLGFDDWIENGCLISRVRVALESEFESDDPNQFVRVNLSDTTKTT